jgi:hypothetical protein
MTQQFYRLRIHIIAISLLGGIVHWYDHFNDVKRMESLDVFSRFLESDPETRIVGGVPVQPGEFPFFVYPVGMMICGAKLIYPE